MNFSLFSVLDAEADEQNLLDVMTVLRPDEMQHFFIKLGIPRGQVEKAEKRRNTADTELQGVEVLLSWKQKNAEHATRRALLNVLESLNYNHSKNQLMAMWKTKYLSEQY